MILDTVNGADLHYAASLLVSVDVAVYVSCRGGVVRWSASYSGTPNTTCNRNIH